MPNGVSCAYFAVKNYSYGKQNNDIFRDVIAGAQTARTVDSIAQGAKVSSPFSSGINKLAKFAKKIVYPLIILSGAYTTFKSDDKLKTGSEQALGISTMYSSELIAEKLLKSFENKFKNSSKVSNNLFAKFLFYFLKGSTFIAASMLGYSAGKNIGANLVDIIRNKQNLHKSINIDYKPDLTNNVYDDFNQFLQDDVFTAKLQES